MTSNSNPLPDQITETIEEIAPDDTSNSKEGLVEVSGKTNQCLKCGYDMINTSTCSSICPNCGAKTDCSDNQI